MNLDKLSMAEFAAQLAGKDPYPGGGGASAAVGALAVALGSMVAEFTIGKKKYAPVEADMIALNERAGALRLHFLELINKDAEGFEPLSKAYGLAKDAPNRDAEMERCLRLAAAAPLDIFDSSCEALDILGEFAQKGSRLLVSDAATGAAFAEAAMKGAAINVKVNTALMKDRSLADSINHHIDDAMEKYGKKAQEIFLSVFKNY